MTLGTLIAALVFFQALGALTGTVTAIWAEFAYVRAHRDGRVSSAEREHLRIIGHGLYFGMMLLLTASLGLVIVAYVAQASQPALSGAYWSFIMVALLIIGVSHLLSKRRIPHVLGSAILFTAWWFLTYLAFGLLGPLSFMASVALFILAAALLYLILSFARSLILHT